MIEIEEIKKAKIQEVENGHRNHNLSDEEMGENQEGGKKEKENAEVRNDNKLKQVEKENRELASSITELRKQIDELKTEMNTKHKETNEMLGLNNKKIMDLKHENGKLRDNVHHLQAKKKN